MRSQISPARPVLGKRRASRKRAPRPLLARGGKLARHIARYSRVMDRPLPAG
jgi:hypothetical protein